LYEGQASLTVDGKEDGGATAAAITTTNGMSNTNSTVATSASDIEINSTNELMLTLAHQPRYQPSARYRSDWLLGAALVLSGHGAGQWRRVQQAGQSNVSWRIERPFLNATEGGEAGAITAQSYVQVGKLEGQLLFVSNTWSGSHFQLYGMCLDCVVAYCAWSVLSKHCIRGVVLGFMPVVREIEAQHMCDPIACIWGLSSLTVCRYHFRHITKGKHVHLIVCCILGQKPAQPCRWMAT